MPVDITEKVRELCRDYPLDENTAAGFKAPQSHRIMSKNTPLNGSKKDYYGHFKVQDKPERLKVKVHGRDGFSIGKQEVDLRYVEQLIDSEQTGALGALLKYAVEKLIDGKYKYFFYYSGNPNDDSGKKIGVAVADSPVGPFKDMGKPIITDSPVGHGQQIDVDVFTDPVSGKSYLYWGNGYMAGAELNDDMVSIKKETLKVMTPKGGTLKDYAYREAPYVFYRQGLYYFLWSVDDTGSANYHVAYGTSDSPLGPIKVAKDPIVMIQDPAKEIYGTAHNSVVRKPGTDEWYIVYHRINKNYLGKDKGPGVHREVCIDRMEFNADGTIQRVKVSK